MTEIRKDIPSQYKWDLSSIFPSIDDFEKEYSDIKERALAFAGREKTMTSSAGALYDALSEYTDIDRGVSKLYDYAMLSSDTDKSDNAGLSLLGRVIKLANDFASASFFVDPALIRLDEARLAQWYEQLPELREFKRVILAQQRYKAHTLSDECEKLLVDMGSALGTHDDIRSVLTASDLRFGKLKGEDGKKIELTDTSYVPLLMSGDRRVRRAAFTKLYETYSQFGNTFAACLDAFVKERAALAKVRSFGSSMEASVFSDEVTPDICNNLIETVNSRMDVLYGYYDLKREVLGVSKLHMYDIYTPLMPAASGSYTFEQAVDEVLGTVKVFGEEYSSVLSNGIRRDRWVDVFPNKGKRGGAYSAGCYDTMPYILLNFTSKLDDVSTLAHEAGHSMHTYFSNKYNTPQNSHYTIFVAEVASTVNELLLSHRLLRQSKSDTEKMSILNQIMETYKGTLYRQTMFAEFEKQIHGLCESGSPLTQELLNTTYFALVKKYFGAHVVCDRQIAYEWMRIPHFYYWFYVYKYATCISAASSIVRKIEQRGGEYVGKYIEFLKCGGSKSPLESLLTAEIDLTQPSVISDAIDDFDETVRQFRLLYNAQKTKG